MAKKVLPRIEELMMRMRGETKNFSKKCAGGMKGDKKSEPERYRYKARTIKRVAIPAVTSSIQGNTCAV